MVKGLYLGSTLQSTRLKHEVYDYTDGQESTMEMVMVVSAAELSSQHNHPLGLGWTGGNNATINK